MIADGTLALIIETLNAHGYPTAVMLPTFEERTAGGMPQASIMNTEARTLMNPGWLEQAMRRDSGKP